MTSGQRVQVSRAADSSPVPAGKTAKWHSAGGTVISQTPDASGGRRLALCPNLAQPDPLHGTASHRWAAREQSTLWHGPCDRPACARCGGSKAGLPARHLAAKHFLRGVNLANSLEAPPGQDWGGTSQRRRPSSHQE